MVSDQSTSGERGGATIWLGGSSHLVVNPGGELEIFRRPQNETYIFGFRKREQGHLAPEIPQFDPLVEAKEKEIAGLRAPKAVTFTLEPVQ